MADTPYPTHEATVGDRVFLNAATAGAREYRWALVQYPRGSHSILRDDGTATPSFIPDEEGEYVFALEVDGLVRSHAAVHAYPHPHDPGPAIGEGAYKDGDKEALDAEDVPMAAPLMVAPEITVATDPQSVSAPRPLAAGTPDEAPPPAPHPSQPKAAGGRAPVAPPGPPPEKK
jgi:hypothetical protein